MSERRYPNVRVRHRSPNQSSRGGVKPRLIVLHSTEGANVKGLADLIGLGGWFGQTRAGVSSHAATDAEGQSARYVADEAKAWHCAGYNSLSLGLEQIGRAAQSSWTDAQVRESARWLAYWSRKHSIPLQRGKVSGGRVIRAGVVTHADLGALGGGHHDPGAGFPVAHCIALARRYRTLQGR